MQVIGCNQYTADKPLLGQFTYLVPLVEDALLCW
ncbi:hypothetical protein ES703_114987 [subsurface metagenome]